MFSPWVRVIVASLKEWASNLGRLKPCCLESYVLLKYVYIICLFFSPNQAPIFDWCVVP